MNKMMTKEEKGNTVATWLLDVILCSIAFLMARIGIQGAYYTLGIAYVATLYETKLLRRWSWLFAVCGIVSLTHFDVDILKYIFMLILVAGCREIVSRMGMKIDAKNQCISVVASIALINTITTCIVGVSAYRLVMGVFEAVVGGGLTYMLMDGIGAIRKNKKVPLTTKEAVSIILITAAVLAGFLDVYLSVPVFKEIYLKDICAFLMMIAVVYLGGINLGVTISVVISSLLVMIGYMPASFTGIYGLTALMGGLFAPLGRVGIIVGAGIGQALGFIVFNNGRLDMPLIGAYLVAGVISLVVPKTYFGMAYWFQEKKQAIDEKEYLLRIQELITDRLKYVVGGFEKLAQSFQGVQEQIVDYTPKMINAIIEETGEKLCSQCSMRGFCWEQDLKKTYEQSYQMVAAIERKGYIAKSDIPQGFSEHCLHAENFAYVLGYKVDLLKQDMIWRNRFLENRTLVAEELGAVAETLKDLIKDVDRKLYFNKDMENLIKEAISSEGIKVSDVTVLENRGRLDTITLHTKPCKGDKEQGQAMARCVSEVVGKHMALEEHQCKEKGCSYKLASANRYHVSAGSAICAKQDISGDVHTFMELSDDQYLLAVADGMGSGMLAYNESAAAMEMLEDFMESGFRKDLAVKMINAALILKSDNELFSTMDITLIDKQTGVAEFLKAGASTSFILREGEIISVQGASLPIGMMKEVDVAIKKIQLQSGDIIIMVTDGMLDTPNDVLGKEETFKHFIREIEASDPQYVADYLMEKSKALLGISERDDMTIVVARVWTDPYQDRI